MCTNDHLKKLIEDNEKVNVGFRLMVTEELREVMVGLGGYKGVVEGLQRMTRSHEESIKKVDNIITKAEGAIIFVTWASKIGIGSVVLGVIGLLIKYLIK